uniref:DNA repair and recombination protein RAD54B n=1 Tax=Lingulaulax polyedra TaxID=160621 RepID=A0A516AG17_LINPO|nr:DNA repair and recombination protein RAD54B [Lingulodinium polyedra]
MAPRSSKAILSWVADFAPDDGVVVVSNFIATLAQCGELCSRLGFATTALVGGTLVNRRVGLVRAFNRSRGLRAFLLSTKAGGVGLNIVGANRLVMMEPDWNPAVDMQAMGRVWRQGQQKPVFIYRLATHGTLEENILQRQARKQGLATVMVDSAQAGNMQVGDWEDLRRVYSLVGYTGTGYPLTSAPPEPESEGIPAEAGIGGAALALLHTVRLLATTRPPERPSTPEASGPVGRAVGSPGTAHDEAGEGEAEAASRATAAVRMQELALRADRAFGAPGGGGPPRKARRT